MKLHHQSLSLEELDLCHEIGLHLLAKLLQSLSSSLAATPPTPSPVTSLAKSLPAACGSDATSSPDSALSLTIQIYDKFLLFFSEFLEDRFVADVASPKRSTADLRHLLSSACNALVLISRLVHNRSDLASSDIEGKEGEIAAPNSFIALCRDHRRLLSFLFLEPPPSPLAPWPDGAVW